MVRKEGLLERGDPGVLRALDRFDILDGMLVSGEEHMLKPAPEFFQRLLDRYGAETCPIELDGRNAVKID